MAGEEQLGRAALGTSFALGGDARLVQDEPPAWRHWVLWAVLALGALSLVLMSVRLIRQLGREEQPTAA